MSSMHRVRAAEKPQGILVTASKALIRASSSPSNATGAAPCPRRPAHGAISST